MAARKVFAPSREEPGRRAALRPSEIDLVIAVEGHAPAAAVRAASRRFGISEAAARSGISRLRKRGLLRTVAVVDRTRCGGAVESVAYIRVDWSHPGSADLEPALSGDLAVTQAARTFGPFDYTAFAIHNDPYEAAAWSRRLQSLPYVSWCRVDRMQTRFERFACAAALLLAPASAGSSCAVAGPGGRARDLAVTRGGGPP